MDALISSYSHVVYTLFVALGKIELRQFSLEKASLKVFCMFFLISQASEMTLDNQYKSVKSVNGSLVTNGDNFFSFNFA